MSDLNADRVLARVLRDLSRRYGVTLESLAQGWIVRLTRGPVVRYVHGYSFDLNTAATQAIACDKAATSDVLAAAGVPRVEHRLCLHPDKARFVPHPGNWRGMLDFFESHGRDVVVKDNTGTGGRGVLRARSAVQLEAAALELFRHGHDVALSPFVEIIEERRFVMLDGACEAAYTKVRPAVTGDGRRTVLELLAEQVRAGGLSAEMSRLLATLDAETAALLREVPGPGVTRLLNWRHNLGQGASVRLLRPEEACEGEAWACARRAGEALNLVFGSVDVVTVGDSGDSGRAMVLEVNSGVMMEALAASPGGPELAQRVYGRAFQRMFGIE
jgi:hypothetical protein